MNIAFLTVGFSKEKKEATKITTLSLARELRNRGHNVYVITEGRKNLPRYEIVDGVPVYRPHRIIGSPHVFNPLTFYNHAFAHARGVGFVQKKEGIKFNIIHSFSAANILGLRSFLGTVYARKAKTVHTIKSRSKYRFGKRFSSVLNLLDAVTVHAEILKTGLLKQGCRRIALIRSHIDSSVFRPLKIKEKKKTILYYGPLAERKGASYLLKAIPHVIKKHPDARFVLLNKEKSYRKAYDSLIARLGIKKYVKILSKTNGLAEEINKASCAVFPYPSLVATESNPSCVIESMACGKPVVTSDLPELKEFLSHGKNSLLAKPKDEKSIAANIIKLLDSATLRKRIGKAAQKKAQEFDVKKIATLYENLYRHLTLKA